MIEALKADTAICSVGLDIGELDALEVHLGDITVTGGIGARIGKAEIHGALTTGEIKVGDPPGKP